MTSFERLLENYATIAVQVALNVQPGQKVWINAPIHQPDFVRLVTRKAYQAGARDVHIEWYDDVCTQLKYRLAPEEAFGEYPSWRVQALEEQAETDGAYLSIESRDPGLLEGVPTSRIAAFSKASGIALKKWRDYLTADKFSWSILAAPSAAWAKKVFPGQEEREAVASLWRAIFQASRADAEDPVAAWREHNAALLARREHLNAKQYRKLHYRAPGTELTVVLPENHEWHGGLSRNERGNVFNANVPTEEVFTSPSRDGTVGVVSSTKPLSYYGNLIEGFSLTFERGRVTDFRADKGYDALKAMIEQDEGARYLGEVALVPHRSPISSSNLVFYNTLFDENASNHLAIGRAFAFCLRGGVSMTPEERRQAGLNESGTHVDFMIGSDRMDIDGELADGTIEPIFRGGNWAF